MRAMAMAGMLLAAGGCRTGATRCGAGERRLVSRMQCLVFWKAEDGREFLGGATMECPEARSYVERMNSGGGRPHWAREILVNVELDPAKDLLDPRNLPAAMKDRPAVKAQPKR